MPVSDPRFAAQLAAPGEEALFFDDIGCLRDFLGSGQADKPGAVAFVADHRTGAWVPAAGAVFSRCPGLETPMGSHLLAWADEASRGADGSATSCVSLERAAVFGPAGPPSGRKG
jgi:copper chaperone NosL